MKSLFILFPVIVLNMGIVLFSGSDTVENKIISYPEETGVLNTIPDTAIQVIPFQLDIIAPSSGVQFFRNEILFLSYSKGADKMTEKHLSFGTLMPFVAMVSDSVPGEHIPFLTGSSVIFPCEATTFSRDYKTMYLSMIPEKKSKEKIFGSRYVQNGWVIDEKPLDFCSDNNIYTHPALSDDGRFMIFSSDMAGSSGGLDLYLTRWENNNWTKPVNLGTLINSPGNELFAKLDNENNLYFSSDGLPGLGGYDIFMCRYFGETWSKPENLTEAINSQNDELAFTVNPLDGKSAFFTSRKKSAKNNTQLFRVTLKTDLSSNQNPSLPSTFLALTGLSRESLYSPTPVIASTASDKSEKKAEETAQAVQIRKETVETDQTTKQVPPAKVAEVKKETKVEPKAESKPATQTDIQKGKVVYRVQILANPKAVGSYELVVSGKTYKTYEYLYAGAYRTTVGEFTNLTEAIPFQNLCRKSGYNQAFIVAFRDNIRTNDPELFKR